MTYKELQYACPIIMNSIHLFPSRKEAFLQQAQFFKNHTFIFNALTPKEANILRLRYGIDDGKILNCQQISELIDVSRARVSQLENRAIAKLRKMKNLFLINKYTDDTFDGNVEDLVEHKKISLIRQDILRTIDDGTLKIINNVSILKLNIDYGRNAKELRDMKISLMNKGIYSCADFVEKVREFDSILQFVTHMQITYTVYNAIM